MSHKEQVDFCNYCKSIFPEYFKNVSVLDVGSQDINGNNKIFFENSEYIGLDIGKGPNVDVVCYIHEYNPNKLFDVIISTEMLEHDKNKQQSLNKMVSLLKPNGLLVFTAGGHNRAEHGTSRTSPDASPYTNDYYGNIYIKDLSNYIDLEKTFKRVIIDYTTPANDLRFIGIKR
jgi:SAM-dependent methyltransferase